MSDFDVEPDMSRSSAMDQKIESLLSATADADDPVVADLVFMRQSLVEAFPLQTVPEHVADAHLARMMAAVAPAAAFTAAKAPADRTGPLETIKASFARRVAAVTLAVSTAFGGAAYAGVLPDPVQRAVAKAASVVGLNLPGGQGDALAEENSRRAGDPSEGAGTPLEDHEERGRQRSEDGAREDAEDRRDGTRDARAEDRDDARDRAEDDADQREDEADDARDALEDARDDEDGKAEDRRDEVEDRRDDDADEREDGADDDADEREDGADDDADEREDEAEGSREDLDEIEEDSRSERDVLDEDEREEESERGEDENDE